MRFGAGPSVTRLLIVASLLLAGWAHALEVLGEPQAMGRTGEYVTLGFRLRGEGTYNYTVSAPEGWEPLSRVGRVTVDGDGFVSVTLRVPRSAPAQSTAEVEIAFIGEAGTDTVVGRGRVLVTAFVALELLAPTDLVGELGKPMELSVVVRNLGNMRDVVTLSADGGMWDVRLAATSVELEPGENREIAVVLTTTGTVSSGYRHFLRVMAVSTNDRNVVARSFTETTFFDSHLQALVAARRDPRLVLALRSGVTGGLRFDESGITPSLGYDVTPRISGALSDYVSVSAGVGSLSGSIVDPFEQVPSRFDVGLSAERWDAAASLAAGTYSVSGGGLVGAWRLVGGATYQSVEDQERFGVTAAAISTLPNLDLQFSGRTASIGPGRIDTVGGRYRTPLAEGLVLSVGADITGVDSSDAYSVTFAVSESLVYQAQAFDVTQSYTGVPQAGLHNFGLSGGLRSAGLIGVRASVNLQMAPSGNTLRNTLTVSTAPVPGLGVSVTGSYVTGTADTTWSVRPSLSLSYRAGGATGSFGVSYAHTGVLRGDLPALDEYFLSTTLRAGFVTLSGAASYRVAGATSTQLGGDSFSVKAGADFRLGLRANIGATYGYESDMMEGLLSTTMSAHWSQEWMEGISSRLSYDREQSTTLATDITNTNERIALIGQVSDLFVDGLNLSAGYALYARDGLFSAQVPIQHDVSVRLGYTFALPFDTPNAVVQVFGGRRGGDVSGVAYMDRDLDGIRGPDEEVLAGLAIMLGGETVVTGADGSYRIRAPQGTHQWSFGAGLPAFVQSMSDQTITIDENSVQAVDLPFVPVVSVNVILFDDVNNDGERDDDETGISFGGVTLEGPVTRSLRVDGRGFITVMGLLPGSYKVQPDPAFLPMRYRATSEPYILTIREGDRPADIFIGAAAPPRQVVTTFTTANLAVLGRVDKTRAAVGDEITVSALVSGSAQSVTAELGGVVVELTNEAGRWSGVLIVPAGIGEGRAIVTVTAVSGAVEAKNQVQLTIAAGGS
ncbi:MAG: hypothetical protein KF813_01230 [Trueperaceae bacterium]|nr:hypothetical protein [Trueperaceae bacterium]